MKLNINISTPGIVVGRVFSVIVVKVGSRLEIPDLLPTKFFPPWLVQHCGALHKPVIAKLGGALLPAHRTMAVRGLDQGLIRPIQHLAPMLPCTYFERANALGNLQLAANNRLYGPGIVIGRAR